MIKPTVGRMVWYRRYGSASPLIEAAIVCGVVNDTTVNLCIFESSGFPSGQSSVHLKQSDDEHPPAPYCEWMPYQLGQAAKTEAAEANALELGAAARRAGPAGPY